MMDDREFALAKATAALDVAARHYEGKGRETSHFYITSLASQLLEWLDDNTDDL